MFMSTFKKMNRFAQTSNMGAEQTSTRQNIYIRLPPQAALQRGYQVSDFIQ